ncbi:M24 family metallopeptidase [Microbacterium oryzae]|uniref:M24 family metallopeptidase n=1 Tax=Microbacterium oryzae TaxID=743009 RepID=A0A6I6DN73_9MICO|nr:M24 family metallopeptidase [Microbacterium oryzae]QGU26375.1 M24 family metallopeptidase [Microbacterium oryzae]
MSTPTEPAISPDRPEKLARVAEILDRRGASAVHLTSGAALAWLLDGARTAVPLGGPPVFSAVVRIDGTVTVTALRNEAERLAEEELAGVDIEVVDWFAPLAPPRPGVLDESEVDVELRAARASLLPAELDRYRRLGADAARAMTEVLTAATPDLTEFELAGRLTHALLTRGAEPAVALVAGAARGGVQHPLPTRAPLGDRAMAVATARRDGLHISITRWVRFRGVEPDGAARILEVEADAWAACRPGRPLGDVLSDIARSYPRHGFAEDAWLRHHQGGPTGYAGRDPKATPDAQDRVAPLQAFAWNPWAPGVKTEDTVVRGAGDAVEVLSADSEWPTVEVRGVARPVALDLT